MTISRLRFAFLALILFLALGMLAFAFSPTVRAAVQAMFSFNGVEIYTDRETGKLSVGGNTDAVIFENGDVVMIEGELGEITVESANGEISDELLAQILEESAEDPSGRVGLTIFGGDKAPDKITFEEAQRIMPTFEIPSVVPKGYELEPYVLQTSDQGVAVVWYNAEWETISYLFGQVDPPELTEEEKRQFETQGISWEEFSFDYSPPEGFNIHTGIPGATLAGTTDDGISYVITTNDDDLTEAGMRAMAP